MCYMKKILKNFKKHLKRRKHHICYTTSALLALGLGMVLAQNDMAPQFQKSPESFQVQDEGQVLEENFVDPREIENTLRDIARLKGEVRGLKRRTAKNPDLQNKITQIITELDTFANNIKNPPSEYTVREALQEFYEARMWEEVGKIRAQIELPQILKDLPMSIKRVDRLIKLKVYQKLGLDTVSITTYLNDVKEAYTTAQTAYNQGNLEDAMTALEFMQENGHPGELEGAIRRLKEISDKIRVVKDSEIRGQFEELLAPIIEAINQGEFRLANELLNDAYPEILMMIKKMYKINQKSRLEILQRLSTVEDQVRTKLEHRQEEEDKIEGSTDQQQPPAKSNLQKQDATTQPQVQETQQIQPPPSSSTPSDGVLPPQTQNTVNTPPLESSHPSTPITDVTPPPFKSN